MMITELYKKVFYKDKIYRIVFISSERDTATLYSDFEQIINAPVSDLKPLDRPTRKELQAQVHALLAQVDEQKQQLAESREAARIVEALESEDIIRLERYPSGQYRCLAYGNDSGKCKSIADALRAAGLLDEQNKPWHTVTDACTNHDCSLCTHVDERIDGKCRFLALANGEKCSCDHGDRCYWQPKQEGAEG